MAMLLPKRSPYSAVPGTPVEFWVITVFLAAETPDDEPYSTTTAPAP